jgi:hypothetical protein
MAYTNNSGQVRIGVRAPLSVTQSVTASTLLTSLYSVWNGDTLGKSLDSSIYGAWNGEISSLVTTLNTSLVSSWNANGNTTDLVGANNGTVVGGLTYSSGKIGNAFTFNGNSYVQLPNNSLNVTANESFSLSSWIYVTSASTYQSIVSSDEWPNTGTMYGWGLRLSPYNSTKMNVEFYTDWQAGTANPDFLQASNSISLNTWIHVLATRNGSTGVEKIYINGSQVTTRTKSVSFISSPRTITPSIGADKYNSTSVGSYISNGSKIDSVSFWRKELSISEVSALYNSGNSIESPYPTSIDTYIQSPNDSVSTNHGTLVGGLTYTTGKVGNAFTFNGTNGYVSFPQNAFNSVLTGDFTVSLWVYLTSVGGNQTITCNMSSPSANYWNGWELRMIGAIPSFLMWNNASTGLRLDGSSLSINTWYNIVLTRKYGSGSKIYINSALSNSNTNTSNPSVSGTFYPSIGALQYDAVNKYYYLSNGSKVDGLNMWNKELTADEVTQLYNSGTGTQYPFSSQTLPSANNQFAIDNGTLMNGCTFTDGKIGKAFTFDGVNDCVVLPTNSLKFVDDFSYSFFVNLGSLSPMYQTVVNAYSFTGVNRGYLIRFTGGVLYFEGIDGNNFVVRCPSTSSVNANQWYHFVITKTNTQVKIYKNGTLENTVNYTQPIGFNDTTIPPAIGACYNYNGTTSVDFISAGSKIDGLSVWKKVLTQAEVTELYNSGNGKQLTIDTKIATNGLVLNLDPSRSSSYPNTGTTLYDISGSGNNGTLVNGVGYTASNGGSMTFDGINDYIQMSNSLTFGTNPFTIEFWIRNTYNHVSGNIRRTILSNYVDYNSGWTSYLYIGIYYGTNSGDFGSFNSNGDIYLINSVGNFIMDSSNTGKINLTNNEWTHVCFVRNGNNISTYKNGTKITTINNVSTLNNNYSGSRSFKIGGGITNSETHQGDLSTIKIYNSALSDLEITQNFNATKFRFGL